MIITKRMIDDAERRGACPQAIRWLRAHPLTAVGAHSHVRPAKPCIFKFTKLTYRPWVRAFNRLYDGHFTPTLPAATIRRSIEDLLRRRLK